VARAGVAKRKLARPLRLPKNAVERLPNAVSVALWPIMLVYVRISR
jgi:hypothetical protein